MFLFNFDDVTRLCKLIYEQKSMFHEKFIKIDDVTRFCMKIVSKLTVKAPSQCLSNTSIDRHFEIWAYFLIRTSRAQQYISQVPLLRSGRCLGVFGVATRHCIETNVEDA